MLRFFWIAFFIFFWSTIKAAGFTHVYFENNVHHFGFVYESQGDVHCTFLFQNTGNKTLLIQKIDSDCGCTSVSASKYKVLKGDTALIHVTFNPAGRKGTFSKNVYFYSNAFQEKIRLNLTGQIIPFYVIEIEEIHYQPEIKLPYQNKKKHGKR